MQTDSNQEEFIQNIRNALGISRENAEKRKSAVFSNRTPVPPDQARLLEAVQSRSQEEQKDLLNRLIQEGKPLNLNVIPVKDEAEASAAIVRLVADTRPEWGDQKSLVQWDHPLINSLDLSKALEDQGVPVHTAAFDTNNNQDRAGQRARIRERVIDAYIGVTSADFCLADTATLVMKSRPGEARSVSLVPSIHVAVIRREQILTDLKDLYALLKWDPAHTPLPHHMVFISGPSKTADIELVMVHGAHGPRALYLYVITG
ncbi:LutC/YkgG family protein [Desulfospira joergensenii]|uniref:LutC/YkgG family protein n=1 Tax=Desulfospira joergensenii TaxID=53329 RepID=UPI0003B39FC6|nr:lactate utilization protein [Desulfospira joergensenii]